MCDWPNSVNCDASESPIESDGNNPQPTNPGTTPSISVTPAPPPPPPQPSIELEEVSSSGSLSGKHYSITYENTLLASEKN